ncbi:hypothetical protein MTR67_027307 [Solanum verrucosum]|uniref:Post-GPI attachment to proteins factor 3 n=1 Tax=Solanum verrucosum TaxID=315347 RepID=A0AAF0TUQ9_SOLVR|nr:uncharacterized protein LOC125834440 [Solanum verrucosum]WMV33922.1 hypothetical protein MTR67_027307 [Solanum verrucosum]
MEICRLLLFFAAISSIFRLIHATSGDADPIYQACVGHCKETGCVGEKCFQHCNFSSGENPIDGPWYLQEPLYQRWKQWDCLSDCRYHCMIAREEGRQKLGLQPSKYHRKWPFQRVYGIQEPVSVAFSVLNLAIQFHGWVSFFILVNYNLPFSPKKKPYYEYTGLWHIYAILSMNSWIWSAVSHSRDVELTEKLDYSSVVAFIGYSLLVAILRAFNVRDEASRVMIAAPIVAFVTTHILYLNFYQLDYGLNIKVCVAMTMLQFILWVVWAGFTRHPSRWKLWLVVAGGILSTLIKIYDFPPYMGYVDADALWHAMSIPLTYLWWSFVRDDSQFGTTTLTKKAQ